MDLLEAPLVAIHIKILPSLTVEERDELGEPSGNVGGREVVDGEVLRGDDALGFPGDLVGDQDGEGALEHLPRRGGLHRLHEGPAHDDAVAALALALAHLHVEPPAAVGLKLGRVEDLEADVLVAVLRGDLHLHRRRLVRQGGLLRGELLLLDLGRHDLHLALVQELLAEDHGLLDAPVLELLDHLLRLLVGRDAVRALAHASAVHGGLPEALLARLLVPDGELAELLDPGGADREQVLLAGLHQVHALVVVAQLGAADEEGAQGVPEVLGEAEVHRLLLRVVDEERGGLGVVGHVGEDKTELVDDVADLEGLQRGGRGGRGRLGDLGAGPHGDPAEAHLAARGAGEGHALALALAAGPEGQHAHAAALLRGGFLLVEGGVIEQLIEHLGAADAVRERQVAGGGRLVVVDELVRPVAVLPLVREPRHLLSELVELAADLAPGLALRGEAELPAAEVLPEAVEGHEVHLGDGLHLGEVHPAALHRPVAGEDDEQAARLGIGGLVVLGVKEVPQLRVVHTHRGLEGGLLALLGPARGLGAPRDGRGEEKRAHALRGGRQGGAGMVGVRACHRPHRGGDAAGELGPRDRAGLLELAGHQESQPGALRGALAAVKRGSDGACGGDRRRTHASLCRAPHDACTPPRRKRA
mmetsp:Transcript_57135/g.124259  ORF Transcript_57135/g.124259 Transcript_57135/m.124259 type:complete len:645 (-) Transcript_57135:8-1942(-)